jgi:hypothetical protein
MSYWEFGKKNGLKGVESDLEELPDGRILTQPNAENPSVLNDDQIAYALRTSRAARTSFDAEFDALDADSQERLTELIELNPRQTALQKDDQQFSDDIQSKGIRSIPVRTTGPKGGKLWRN